MRNIDRSPTLTLQDHQLQHQQDTMLNCGVDGKRQQQHRHPEQEDRPSSSKSMSNGPNGTTKATMFLRKRRLDETRDILQHMKQLEDTTYSKPTAGASNRMVGTSLTSTLLPSPFDGLWRQQIIEWMYTLVKYCKLRHEAATAATHYLDQAVCRQLVTTPSQYQLCAMTSLYLALKIYDSPSMRIVKLSSLVKLGNGDFVVADIVNMERQLVKVLQWRLNPVTTNCFLQQYLHVLEECLILNGLHNVDLTDVEDLALQYIEIAVARDTFLVQPRSKVAYSSLLLAIEEAASRVLQHPQQQQLQQHEQNLLALRETFHQYMFDVTDINRQDDGVVRSIEMLEQVTGKKIFAGRTSRSILVNDTSMETSSSSTTTPITNVSINQIVTEAGSPTTPFELDATAFNQLNGRNITQQCHDGTNSNSILTKNDESTTLFDRQNSMSSSSCLTTMSRNTSMASTMTTTPMSQYAATTTTTGNSIICSINSSTDVRAMELESSNPTDHRNVAVDGKTSSRSVASANATTERASAAIVVGTASYSLDDEDPDVAQFLETAYSPNFVYMQ